ncbi:MAG TPA: MmcQ/YjbR family DNA-binding protein [Planctomycetaceae bacterium]
MPTSKTVRQLALALPNAAERPSYGTPGFFVRKKLFVRILPDEDLAVFKIDFDRRDVLMKSDPQAYFITDHYRNYPMMIVRLSSVDRSDLKELIENAWQFASE